VRISRDEMFLRVAEVVAERGTCLRATVGAVIVRGGRIISIGYNGAPPGQPHCEDVGCDVPLKSAGCVRAIHAETNAIIWAAREGISTDRAAMYCTHSPCVSCAVAVVVSGISGYYYLYDYRDPAGLKILYDSGVEYDKVDLNGTRYPTDAEDSESVSGSADHSGHTD